MDLNNLFTQDTENRRIYINNNKIQLIINKCISKYNFIANKNFIDKEDLYMYAIELLIEYITEKDIEEFTDKEINYYRVFLYQRMRDYANLDVRIRKKEGQDEFLKLKTISNYCKTEDGEIFDMFENIPEDVDKLKYVETLYSEIYDYELDDILTKKQIRTLKVLLDNNMSINASSIELQESWYNTSRTLKSIRRRIKREFYKRNKNNINNNGKLIEDRGIITEFLENIPFDNVDYYGYVYNFIESNIEKRFIEEILESLNIYNYKNIKCSQINQFIVKVKEKLIKIDTKY